MADRRNAGPADDPNFPANARGSSPRASDAETSPPAPERREDADRSALPPEGCRALAAACLAEMSGGRDASLAQSLGVPADAMWRLGLGWWDSERVHTFPMRDGAGRVVGVRTFTRIGRPVTTTVGRPGVFVPSTWCDDDLRDDPYDDPDRPSGPPDRPPRLLVAVGPIDAACGLAWGLPTIGRPDSAGGLSAVGGWVDRLRPAEVIILTTADAADRRGAENLAAALLPTTPLRVFELEGWIEDARDWYRSGGVDAARVAAAFDAATLRTPPRRSATSSEARTDGGQP